MTKPSELRGVVPCLLVLFAVACGSAKTPDTVDPGAADAGGDDDGGGGGDPGMTAPTNAASTSRDASTLSSNDGSSAAVDGSLPPSQPGDASPQPVDSSQPIGQPPRGSTCSGTGLIFTNVPDECMDDGGDSDEGDTLQIFCVDSIPRYCLSGEDCPWRDGDPTSPSVTCSNAGLHSTYLAHVFVSQPACTSYGVHEWFCCSDSGAISFSGCEGM